MEETPVLRLKKPGLSDPVDIRDLNANADALEAVLSKVAVPIQTETGIQLKTGDGRILKPVPTGTCITPLTNSSAISVGNGDTAVLVNTLYRAGAGQSVVFHTEVKYSVTAETQAVVTVSYSVNGEAAAYQPMETATAGTHLLHLMFPFTNGDGSSGTFQARISVSGGNISVAAGDVQGVIMGAGYLPESNWTLTDPETDPAIDRIEIRALPQKTSYLEGDVLNYSGVSVVAIMSNGEEQDVTANCVFDPEDGITVGLQ